MEAKLDVAIVNTHSISPNVLGKLLVQCSSRDIVTKFTFCDFFSDVDTKAGKKLRYDSHFPDSVEFFLKNFI